MRLESMSQQPLDYGAITERRSGRTRWGSLACSVPQIL